MTIEPRFFSSSFPLNESEKHTSFDQNFLSEFFLRNIPYNAYTNTNSSDFLLSNAASDQKPLKNNRPMQYKLYGAEAKIKSIESILSGNSIRNANEKFNVHNRSIYQWVTILRKEPGCFH